MYRTVTNSGNSESKNFAQLIKLRTPSVNVCVYVWTVNTCLAMKWHQNVPFRFLYLSTENNTEKGMQKHVATMINTRHSSSMAKDENWTLNNANGKAFIDVKGEYCLALGILTRTVWIVNNLLPFHFIVLCAVHASSRTCAQWYETMQNWRTHSFISRVALSYCATFWLTNLTIQKKVHLSKCCWRTFSPYCFLSPFFFFLMNKLQKSAVLSKNYPEYYSIFQWWNAFDYNNIGDIWWH